MNKSLKIILMLSLAVLAACQNVSVNQNALSNQKANVNLNSAPTANFNVNSTKKDSHEHAAPHGGTLIAFGEEFAHLELVLDSSNGQITAYALDGEAEKSVQIAQETIEIEIEKPKKITVILAAQENALTGEKKGATSEFRVQSEQLKDLKEFDAKIKTIMIRGKKFDNTYFNFPKGNEDKHQH